MARAAIPAMAKFFIWASSAATREDEHPTRRNQLTFSKYCAALQKCNLASNHSQCSREPQRYLWDVGDKPKEYQHGAQPGQHRDRDFADTHLCDAAGNIQIE